MWAIAAFHSCMASSQSDFHPIDSFGTTPDIPCPFGWGGSQRLDAEDGFGDQEVDHQAQGVDHSGDEWVGEHGGINANF
ncbi:hypothetical protein GCM10023190_25820 [Enteractinococcus fodinae]